MEVVCVSISFEKLALSHQLLLSGELTLHLSWIHFLSKETIFTGLGWWHIDVLIQYLIRTRQATRLCRFASHHLDVRLWIRFSELRQLGTTRCGLLAIVCIRISRLLLSTALFEALRAEGLAHAFVSDHFLSVWTSFSCSGWVKGIFRWCKHQLGQFNEAWPLSLIKLKHKSDDFNNVIWIALPKLFEPLLDQLLSIIDSIFLIETSYILHGCKLEENQATWVNIRFEEVMDNMPRISSLFNVCLPQNRTKVLRRSSNRSHGPHPSVVLILEIVFRFTKVNDFDLAALHEELVCRFQIPVCHPDRLEVAEGANHANYHFLQFILTPEHSLLLALTKHVL